MMIVLYFIRFNYKKLYMINKILIYNRKKGFQIFSVWFEGSFRFRKLSCGIDALPRKLICTYIVVVSFLFNYI